MNLHLLTYKMPRNPDSGLGRSMQLLETAAHAQGHALHIIDAKQCKMKFGNGPELLIDGEPATGIHSLLVKPMFSGRDLYVHANLIKQFELLGIPTINDHQSTINTKNKLTTLQLLSEYNIPIPKTYVLRSVEYISSVMKDIGSYPVIMKAVAGKAGIGVSIIESQRALRSIMDMLIEDEFSAPITLQRYVRESKGRDIRVFLVDGKIVAAMERIATRKGEFRSNFSLGGKVKIAELTEEERAVAIKATQACGLAIAGVDIIRTNEGPQVLEVNSNPGLKGITEATGIDIASEIIAYMAEVAEADMRKHG